MADLSFEEFSARATAAGFDEVMVREWAPDAVTQTHSHPFDVDAIVARGEFWLTCGDETRHICSGGTFDLPRDVPHAERYGPEGATVWVARRNAGSR
jgi:quercetin dioxygenase-like cupin family protein